MQKQSEVFLSGIRLGRGSSRGHSLVSSHAYTGRAGLRAELGEVRKALGYLRWGFRVLDVGV